VDLSCEYSDSTGYESDFQNFFIRHNHKYLSFSKDLHDFDKSNESSRTTLLDFQIWICQSESMDSTRIVTMNPDFQKVQFIIVIDKSNLPYP
jgi:hypothetical protein